VRAGDVHEGAQREGEGAKPCQAAPSLPAEAALCWEAGSGDRPNSASPPWDIACLQRDEAIVLAGYDHPDGINARVCCVYCY